MEQVFLLNEGDRASFLQNIIHSFGCTYICLWSYFPQRPNYMYCMDGLYHEQNNQGSSSSSSSGSLAMLFNDYQKSVFTTDNSTGVPGFAFKNNLPYIELKDLDLAKLASTKSQLQFYQEARIKTAIFMGCRTGEIELGMSNDSQVNLEREIKKLFPNDFTQQAVLPREAFAQQVDQNRASSSSSSLRSLSKENSPEYSPFLLDIINPTTSYIPEVLPLKEAPFEQARRPTIIGPVQQALSQIRSSQLIPTMESEEAAMTKAILAVISNSTDASPSSSSHLYQTPQKASAFKSYRSSLAPTTQISTRIQNRHNLIKRSISFFRSLSQSRGQGQLIQTVRPTTNQLHHMISERRRREKLNESFQALRSLLPPGSKRDKASVLANTTEYFTSLKAQIEELNKRNQMLQAQLAQKEAPNQEASSSFSGKRLIIRITDTPESTSESRIVDLEVNARGESIILDLVIRVLEFLKQVEYVNIMSLEAEARKVESASANRVVLRLRIQATEWDQSGFQEAVRRVVDDLAQ